MKRLLAILVLACLVLAGCAEENAYIPTGGGFQVVQDNDGDLPF